jgi:hypothetical protein
VTKFRSGTLRCAVAVAATIDGGLKDHRYETFGVSANLAHIFVLQKHDRLLLQIRIIIVEGIA